MPIDPSEFRTGGALQGAVAASLVRQRDAAAELGPQSQMGIYRIVRELGRGGMAIVYLAERADGEYQQQVALKWMLQAQPDPASEALFRRERQALADLRHPHIARLLDGGRSDEGRPWFAMEYIQGEPLDRHCVEAALPQPQRLELFLQVCAAVAFAHARGVIHRDIKPSNVLYDHDGGAKLLDFGIAQLLGQDDGLAARAYTPGFASPEQARGEVLTIASDVYQLGRLLASLLSAHAQEQATLAAHTLSTVDLEADMSDASSSPLVPAGMNADLTAILRKACALDPTRRYASADALADDVRAFLERRPVMARRRRAGYVATRYVQRHPFAVGLGALALLTLIATVAAFTWRLAQERDNARLEASRAEAGEEFLISLFRVSDPGVNRGERLTARELLDRGAQRIESDVRTPPRVRVRLLQVLAEVNFSLGEYEPAQRLLERALSEPVEPLQRLPLLAQRLWLLQRRGDAAATVEQAPQVIAAIPSATDFDAVRARILNAAARAAAQTGDERAADWQVQAMTAAQRAGDLEQQGNAMRTLGFLQELKGDYDAALTSTTRAVELLTESVGETSPEVFSARNNRIYLLGETGERQQALTEVEKLSRDAMAVIPPNHIASIYIETSRAMIYRINDRAEESLAIALGVAERCIATLGEDHMQCGSAMLAVANPLSDLDRPADALPWLERLVRSRREGMGVDHIYTTYAEHWLARAYCQTGRQDEGQVIAVRVAQRFARELPADNYDRRASQETLTLCSAASSRPEG